MNTGCLYFCVNKILIFEIQSNFVFDQAINGNIIQNKEGLALNLILHKLWIFVNLWIYCFHMPNCCWCVLWIRDQALASGY